MNNKWFFYDYLLKAHYLLKAIFMIDKYLIITTIILTLFSCKDKPKINTEKEVLTRHYYFIRHAEKDRSNPNNDNPDLTNEGILRAKNWSEILGNIKFDAVYSTNFKRTIQTAKPTAAKNNIKITIYKPNNLDIDTFINDTKGKNILVVGHSNTIPHLVNTIIKKQVYKDIDDYNYGNLYHITTTNHGVSGYELIIY